MIRSFKTLSLILAAGLEEIPGPVLDRYCETTGDGTYEWLLGLKGAVAVLEPSTPPAITGGLALVVCGKDGCAAPTGDVVVLVGEEITVKATVGPSGSSFTCETDGSAATCDYTSPPPPVEIHVDWGDGSGGVT